MCVSVFGYHGRALRIDLTTRHVCDVPVSPDVLRRFVGGTGLGTWLVLEESSDLQNPLAPEAPLAFVFSPLVGSPLTTSAKFAVMGQSPLTGRINDSLSSSHFAIAGKKTGYDALIIVGAAEAPTCLAIEPSGVRFEDATPEWGRSSSHAADSLKGRLGRDVQVAAIGPAGENLVRFATISHDGRHAGRGGLGAVMGSKMLKAVAVRGDRLVDYADPKRLYAYSKQLSKQSLGPATAKYRELGTVSNLLTFNRLGTLPTRNFQQGSFEHAEAVSFETPTANHPRTRTSCAACTIGCEHLFQLPGQAGDGPQRVRLEYENIFALGPLCGISDPDAVLKASSLCDEWGIDTISAGATIAFAMECAERGLLEEPSLRFGNADALLETLALIGSRQGLGELLSLGTRAAASEIGQGSEEFAPHVKGLELPGYEPRALQTMALGFAVTARGADHNRSGAYQVDFSDRVDRLNVGDESVRLAVETEDEAAVMDSLVLCKFLRGIFEDRFSAMAEMLAMVTGWDVTASELRQTARRIVTAKKWYNIRQGWQPSEDTLPQRFLTERLPSEDGSAASLSEQKLNSLVRAYNRQRGWTDDGWIPENRLAEMELLTASTVDITN